jgi:hypothetical protein
VNDAERLSQDPTFRLIGSEKIWDRGAALPSRLHWFETEVLNQEQNLEGLSRINRELLANAEAMDSAQRVVLDMDSTEIPVYGEQEFSAYNGHFESTCYHPLLLFNGEGDCLGAKLRPGNVHSAEDWDEVLLPEIERQQELGKEVVFRADAAFAKPEIYEALEERGVKYAIRLPANGSLLRDIEELLDAPGRTAQSQTRRVVQRLSLSGGQLGDGAKGGRESRVSFWRVVPSIRVHRDQLGDTRPGGGAVLQQARDSGAMDKGR